MFIFSICYIFIYIGYFIYLHIQDILIYWIYSYIKYAGYVIYWNILYMLYSRIYKIFEKYNCYMKRKP